MARTKAAKLKSKRAGRPRLPAEDIEPNGRQSRRVESKKAAHMESERETQETVIEARIRKAWFGDGEIITAEQAKERLRGFTLGLMHMDGDIDKRQLAAGIWYAEMKSRYYGLTGIAFPSARAQNLFAVRGHDGEVSEGRACAARAASDQMMKVEGLLLSMKDGRQIKTAVDNACFLDIETARGWPHHMMVWLNAGLSRLVDAYDIQPWRG